MSTVQCGHFLLINQMTDDMTIMIDTSVNCRMVTIWTFLLRASRIAISSLGMI